MLGQNILSDIVRGPRFGDGSHRIGHRMACVRIRQKFSNSLKETRTVKLGVFNYAHGADLRKRGCIGALMVVCGMREWNEDCRKTVQWKLGKGHSAGAADHDVRVRIVHVYVVKDPRADESLLSCQL